MGDELVVERSQKRQPLVALPRHQARDDDGIRPRPVVVIDLDFAKGVAGCCICNKPIPKQTTRLKLTVQLPVPVKNENGSQRTQETYYLHPGCITDRIRPEVIRMGFDCFDCGLPPPSSDEHPYARHPHTCFTVSKFAPAPLCMKCLDKPKWDTCDICQVVFPKWMVLAVDDERATDEYKRAQSAGFEFDTVNIYGAQRVCEYCAQRHQIRTSREVAEAEEQFRKLRDEIAAHGIFAAGDAEF